MRFKHQAWSDLLARAEVLDEFKDIPIGISRGFLIGLKGLALLKMYIPNNHILSAQHEDFVVEKYAEERLKGRISKEYDLEELQKLIGNLRTAPLSVVESQSGKKHVIINHFFLGSSTPIDPTDLPLEIQQSGVFVLHPCI